MSVRRCEQISPLNFVADLPSETLTFATPGPVTMEPWSQSWVTRIARMFH